MMAITIIMNAHRVAYIVVAAVYIYRYGNIETSPRLSRLAIEKSI